MSYVDNGGSGQIMKIGNKRPLFKHHLRSQVNLDIFLQIEDKCVE